MTDLEKRIEKLEETINDCWRDWNQYEEHYMYQQADFCKKEAERLQKVLENLKNLKNSQ